MQFQFSFKHMDVSPALQNYAEEKIRERIQKFVTKPVEAHVVFSVMKHTQTAHLKFRGGDGFDVEVEESSADMYASVDILADKLVVQLKKQKEKLKDHKQAKLNDVLQVLDGTEAEKANAVDAAEILKFEAARKRARG